MDGHKEGGTETIPQVPDRSCGNVSRFVRLVTDCYPDAGNVPAQ